MAKLLPFLYRWLPIFMGCHCRPDRSFHYHGRPFPICARCTGMLLGFLTALFTAWFLKIPLRWPVILMLPGILDGTLQKLTSYESNNLRRVITGYFMGFGSMTLLIRSLMGTYALGKMLGERLSGF